MSRPARLISGSKKELLSKLPNYVYENVISNVLSVCFTHILITVLCKYKEAGYYGKYKVNNVDK